MRWGRQRGDIPRYDRRVTVEKFAVSFTPELAARVRGEAETSGETISGWLADAASRKLRRAAASAALADYEAAHGEIAAEELDRVRSQWPA